MIKVKLRAKTISEERQSLYLDIYPALLNLLTGTKTRREFFNLYTYNNPETPEQVNHNKNSILKANETLQIKKALLERCE